MHRGAILDTARIHRGAILDKARMHRGAILAVQGSLSRGAILGQDNISWSAHSPVTLENWISFQDGQMILIPFFEIPYGKRLAKNVKSQYVQVIPKSTISRTETKIIHEKLQDAIPIIPSNKI